uniref:Ig-like domain-containing protein n=1 Tax=Leptobrachium leishanense TaxID=445787 RepID=A0A8C5QKC3_9ANUR
MRAFPPAVPALYCCLIHVTGVLAGLHVKTHNVTATVGSDVTLRCELSSNVAKVIQVNWKLCDGPFISSHLLDKEHIAPEFARKVTLTDEYGITIRNVTYSDTNIYCCTFSIFPLGSLTGEIFLQVTERNTERSLFLWVALGALILPIIGIAIVISCKRKSRWQPNNSDQNDYTRPAFPMIEASVPATDRETEGGHNEQEYFNILLYQQP